MPNLSGRAIRLGLAVVALVIVGGHWLSTTRPADPVSPGPGLGIVGGGANDVPIGSSVAFVGYLIGTSFHSHAVVTGVTLACIPGVRLALRQVAGPPHGAGITGPLRQNGGSPSDVTLSQLRPLVGATLRRPPASAPGWRGTWLTFALVVTPTRSGCFTISGPVEIRYRVEDTTFTRSMSGADTVATPGQTCFTADGT